MAQLGAVDPVPASRASDSLRSPPSCPCGPPGIPETHPVLLAPKLPANMNYRVLRIARTARWRPSARISLTAFAALAVTPGSFAQRASEGPTTPQLVLEPPRAFGRLVINEIMYNEAKDDREDRRRGASRGRRREDARARPGDDAGLAPAPLSSAPAAGDWIELHNPGDGAVDITGFTLIGSRSKKDDEEDAFEIPPGAAAPVPPGGYLVLARRADAFAASRPELVLGVDVVNGSFGFNLSPKGELLTVLDRSGALVDAVEYDDEDGWPEAADGGGASLELVDPGLDRSDPFSWSASVVVGGTPGRRNDAR